MKRPVRLHLLLLLVALFVAACSYAVRDFNGNNAVTTTSSVPVVENWAFKRVAVTQKSESGAYQMVYKYWESGDGTEGLTLSTIFRGHETFIARAWNKNGIVQSAVQPKDNQWVMIRFTQKEWDRTLGYMNEPTEIVKKPGGVSISFVDIDGNKVEVNIIFDPRILPGHEPLKNL